LETSGTGWQRKAWPKEDVPGSNPNLKGRRKKKLKGECKGEKELKGECKSANYQQGSRLKEGKRIATSKQGLKVKCKPHQKAQGGVQILKKLKGECRSSRGSAHSETAQGGVQVVNNKAQGMRSATSEQGLKREYKPHQKAQEGVQILKRLKGECKS
jgi:hypothetical protein